MKKEIKKIGNSLGVIFNKNECKLYELKEGTVVDLGDLVPEKKRKK